jgi:16S rRNA (uracil1498-N3)-methyltransferase
MKLHKFFARITLQPGRVVLADKALSHQLKKVLRMEPGTQILLADENGNEAPATIIGYGEGAVELELEKPKANTIETGKEIILYAALVKRENFELIAQKATEVGVSELVPTITERTVKQGVKHERLQKIMTEAAEQSGRGLVPKLHEPITFQQALLEAKKNGLNILFHPGGRAALPKRAAKRTGLFVGPEGGFTENEIVKAKRARCAIVRLSPLTLRAETAAIIGSYLAAEHA